MLIIKGLMPSQLRINILYYLYIRPLNGLTKPSSILSLISLPFLTASRYKRVTNKRPHLYHISANLNITLYPLVYAMAQATFKATSTIPYKITLTIFTLHTQTTYLFTITTLLSTLNIFKKYCNTLKTQGLILILRNATFQLKK